VTDFTSLWNRTRPFVSPLSEPALADMMKWGRDTVWPDELVDIEGLAGIGSLIIFYFIFNYKHLRERLCQTQGQTLSTEINLTYIRDFEHLLIVEGFL
jgi:hypothetical protein